MVPQYQSVRWLNSLITDRLDFSERLRRKNGRKACGLRERGWETKATRSQPGVNPDYQWIYFMRLRCLGINPFAQVQACLLFTAARHCQWKGKDSSHFLSWCLLFWTLNFTPFSSTNKPFPQPAAEAPSPPWEESPMRPCGVGWFFPHWRGHS